MTTTPKKPFDPADPERRELAKMLIRNAHIVRRMPLTREVLETIDTLARRLYLSPGMDQEEAEAVLDRISKLAMAALVAAATDILQTVTEAEQRKAKEAVAH